MKHKIITTLIAVILAFPAIAQQGVLLSQYFFDPLYINPAYAGSRGAFSGTLTYRDQWVGLPGAPETEALSVHTPIPLTSLGIGLQLDNDVTGPLRISTATLNLSSTVHLTKEIKLAFGLAGSLNDVVVNDNELNIETPNDPVFPAGSNSLLVPDANAGIYLYKSTFYFGAAAVHILQSTWAEKNQPAFPSGDFYRQYFVTSGIVAKLSDNLAIRPSALVQFIQTAPALYELDASFIFSNKLFIGAGFRNNERISISGTDNYIIPCIEYDFAAFRIGYSYDIVLNSQNISGGTHEIMLGWDLGGDNLLKRENPRYF